jgi:hypothetical protein
LTPTLDVHAAGRLCAAAEVVVDPTAPVERWELVAPVAPNYPVDGYVVETGVGSFGAIDALLDPPMDAMAAAPFWSRKHTGSSSTPNPAGASSPSPSPVRTRSAERGVASTLPAGSFAS